MIIPQRLTPMRYFLCVVALVKFLQHSLGAGQLILEHVAADGALE
jgi:hypothetical protein